MIKNLVLMGIIKDGLAGTGEIMLILSEHPWGRDGGCVADLYYF